MTGEILKNKPLIEAIFELRWKLKGGLPEAPVDPHYKILVGRIYDRVHSEYVYHETLPTASMPDEIAAYIVQHRFRRRTHEWPLIQLGPGIITLNDTEAYTWDDFEQRIAQVIDTLFESYPDADELEFSSVQLRYLDGIEFDYENENVFEFISDKMKVGLSIDSSFFIETGVQQLPLAHDVKFVFPSTKPEGNILLRFVRGSKNDVDALIWETNIQAFDAKVPSTKDEVLAWVISAHNLTHDWFFKIIEGDLQRRFE